MVTPPDFSAKLAPLDRKLLRDLWRMRGQAIAIALVVALGVLTLVMMDGLLNSIQETRRAYYERYRIADIFAPAKRAPMQLLEELAAIPGVSRVEGRIRGGALIDIPGMALPIPAQALSLSDQRDQALNDIYLSRGRHIAQGREDEIILLNAFAHHHGLLPGDSIAATINGSRRRLHIVGLAQSPEFLYSAPPGEMMSDDGRFAVVWMSRRAMEAAYDLRGAFNEALLATASDANQALILSTCKRILDHYGGHVAYSLADHVSDRFIQEEIAGLKVSSKTLPPIFLAVAAFLLNIVVSRMVQSEREQIGLLKAFGYSSYEIGGHYLKFSLIIASSGAVVGSLLGVLAGHRLVEVFMLYYKFPFLVFHLDPGAAAIGFTISVLAAASGGIFVLREVFRLTPAVAMRPAAPRDYSRAVQFGRTMRRVLDQPSRMILRRLLRQPGRACLAVLGIAAGMALSVAMLGAMSGFDRSVVINFEIIDRSDMQIHFVEPLSVKALSELKRMPGIIDIEGFRHVPAVLRHQRYSYRGAVSGLPSSPRLQRAIDSDMKSIYVRSDGVVLAKALAKILHISAGEILSIELSEGRRPVIEVPVVGIANSLFGAPAYMELNAINRALKEPDKISGAYARIDRNHAETLYIELKNMPTVAGVSVKDEARTSFQNMLDNGAGVTRYIMTAVAGIICFGIVYNSARIAFAERERDLASLRVIGFSRGETAYVLLGELAIITVAALLLGSLIGYYLAHAIAEGFSTDLYQIPATVTTENLGSAAIAVLIASGFSAWLLIRDINRLDLIAALKTRE